jgi:hypothetical protein
MRRRRSHAFGGSSSATATLSTTWGASPVGLRHRGNSNTSTTFRTPGLYSNTLHGSSRRQCATTRHSPLGQRRNWLRAWRRSCSRSAGSPSTTATTFQNVSRQAEEALCVHLRQLLPVRTRPAPYGRCSERLSRSLTALPSCARSTERVMDVVLSSPDSDRAMRVLPSMVRDYGVSSCLIRCQTHVLPGGSQERLGAELKQLIRSTHSPEL